MNRKYQIKRIMGWLIRYMFSTQYSNDYNDNVNQMIELFDRYVRTRGIVWSIKRLKLIRLCTTRYMCGQPFRIYPEKIGLTKDGFPKSICFLKEHIDSGNKDRIRFSLTLLNISRSFIANGKVDLSTITNPNRGTQDTIDREFIKKYVNDFNLKVDVIPFSFDSFFFTMKSGPFGNQLATALQSFKKWTGSMHNSATILSSTSFTVVKDWYKEQIANINPEYSNKTKFQSNFTRRLSIVSDSELKERVIAIFDYMSQVILEPLSKQLFSLLRNNIPQDRTFTQDPIITNKISDRDSFHSLDLSAATDRVPVRLIRDLISEMLEGHESYGYAWYNMMCKQSTVDHTGEPIAYAVGQPMGARSSWVGFTHSHHLLIQYSAHLVNKYPTDQYILLGDDVVIYDDEIAKSYLEIMDKLGVDISPAKSHVSIDTYEFAKRWFKSGIEVSGYPFKGLLSMLSNPIGFYGLVINMIERGYHLNTLSYKAVSQFFISNYKDLRKIKTLRHTLEVYFTTQRLLNNFNYDEARSFIAKATSNNDYAIPYCEEDLKSEILRVSNKVHMQKSFEIRRSYSVFYDNLIDSLRTKFYLPETFEDIIMGNPYAIALRNQIESLTDKPLIANMEEMKERIQALSLLDPLELAKKKRTLDMKRESISVFGNRLFNQFRDYPEDTLNINTTMSVMKSSKDLKRIIKMNYKWNKE